MNEVSTTLSLTEQLNPLAWPSAVYFLLIGAVLGVRWLLPLSPRWSVRVARELFLLLPAVLLYFAVRGLVDAREEDAVRNAGRIIDLERSLGLLREATLQGWALQWDRLVDLMNWIYIWGHWPVLTATALWLLMRHPREYPAYRNTLLISGAIGMAIFALFPVAPPRLMPDMAFVDTVTQQSQSYRVLQPTSLTNPYAAVPSFHFGWNLLMGIAIVRLASARFARVFGALMPVAMLLAIVLTANHYLLDAVIGGALVLSSLWAAMMLADWGRVPRRVSATVPSPGTPGRRVATTWGD